MTKIIVDTNIIFSALLKHNTIQRYTLLNKDYQFYLPNKFLVELFKNKEKLLKFSTLSEEDILSYLSEILENVSFINPEVISDEALNKAYEMCKDYDEDDTPFVALALELGANYWTGDKIKQYLKAKGFDNFFSGIIE